MGKFADQVQANFATREAKVIEVPEWSMSLTVFPLTIGQLTDIEKEQDLYRKAAKIVCVRARTPEGRPLFDAEDFEKLCTHGVGPYGPEVVARVAGEMMEGTPTEEDIEGN